MRLDVKGQDSPSPFKVPDLTPQGAFDAVVDRLFDGKGRSHSAGACEYRTSDGNNCAAGALLSEQALDALDDNGANSSDWTSVVDYFEDLGFIVPEWARERANVIVSLQYVHDEGDHWQDGSINELGVDAMRDVAQQHNLNTDHLAAVAAKRGLS